MANPYDFTRIAEGDILYDPKAPQNFLPTGLKQQGGILTWTAPGYATYGTTPTNNDILYSSCAVYTYKLEEKIILPPNIQKIADESNTTKYKKNYLAQYKNAAATIDHYFKTNAADDQNFARAVSNWKETCNKLVENPYFTDGWDLPASFPFYSNASTKAYKDFFKKQETLQPESPWKKRLQHAENMHNAWEQMFFYVISPNEIPFPKSLWYHKYFIVYTRKQPDLWTNYFNNTCFSDWGKIE